MVMMIIRIPLNDGVCIWCLAAQRDEARATYEPTIDEIFDFFETLTWRKIYSIQRIIKPWLVHK